MSAAAAATTPTPHQLTRRLHRIADPHQRERALRRLELRDCLPSGAEFINSPGAWIKAIRADPDYQARRADWRHNMDKVVWKLAREASWTDLTARIGWDRTWQEAGISRSTLADRLQWLREHLYLGWVERGSTPDHRPGVLLSADKARTDVDASRIGNRQPVYLLTVPETPQEITRTPPHEVGVCETHPPRARTTDHPRSLETFTAVPRTRRERLKAGDELRRRSRSSSEHSGVLALHPLRRLTDRHVAHLCRPFFDAGWTPSDVLHAIDHTPNGQQHWQTGPVRSPAAWLRHRLDPWLVDGEPRRSHRQQLAAGATAERARQRAAREQNAAARQLAAPPNEAYRRARQALRGLPTHRFCD